MSNQKGIIIEGLSAGYGKKTIIKDIDLSVATGEIVVLAGPNGSGKSTLIKAIAREIAYSGKISLGDKDIQDIGREELSRRLSIMMTERRSPEYMTVKEIVAMGRYPYTGSFGRLRDEDKKVIGEAIDLTEISDIADSEFACLSDGQKQRVLLARAIAQEPEVLVLDEPASYLDIKYRLLLISALKRIAKEKKPAILVSMHELSDVKILADKVCTIGDGRIQKTGRPNEVLTDDYVKELYDISEELWGQTLI